MVLSVCGSQAARSRVGIGPTRFVGPSRRALDGASGLLTVIVLCLTSCTVFGQESGDALLRDAEARIERHRKAEAQVVIVDSSKRPLVDAKVEVRQTRHAFLFGCNLFLWGRVGSDADEQKYRTQYAALFNYATLPFYWATYERNQGEPGHRPVEEAARWCREHKIATKGHPLAWNYSDPAWLPDDPEEIRRLQLARIDDCVTRFRGLIDRWDVVNEATHFERDSFKKRAPKMTRMWETVGRLELVRQCFDHARTSNPQATLLINDYRTDPAYENVLRQLIPEGEEPVFDVIGIQSHMHGGPWSNDKIWDVCQRFARFGVPLHFTETTIVSGERSTRGGDWPTTEEGELRQARETERFYTMLFSHPAVEAITWWDFSDRRAWQGAPAGMIRKDMSPKPVYRRLLDLVKKKWWSRFDLQADDQGRAQFRGFLGDYELTVWANGKRTSHRMTLTKDSPNELTVVVP